MIGSSYEQLLTAWNNDLIVKEVAKLFTILRILLWNLYLIISDVLLGY